MPASRDIPAIEGGTPVRDTRVAFTRPSVGAEEERAVLEVLRSGWLTTGPVTERFEDAFRGFVGVPHAVGVSSCTAGLHLLLRAAGVGPGDEVITSPMTFPASVNAILHAGARPVLADVLPRLLTLDPAAVSERVGSRTRALLVVHFAGWPAQMNGLLAIARSAGIATIEDAAHAVGATYAGLSVGTLADGAAFSFYATKNLTTGEGGMVTTANDEWAERIRCERLHGLDVDASRRDGADYRHWEAVRLGFKYNLGDLAAALGLVQLERLPEMLARRRGADERYRRGLADLKEIETVVGPSEACGAAHLFPILLAKDALRVGRDRVLAALIAENIGVGVHFRAIPAHRFFREDVGLEGADVPVAMDASERTLSLPLSAEMTEAEQDDVLTALRRIVRYYRA